MKSLFNNHTLLERGIDEDAKQYAYRVLKTSIMELVLPPNYKLNELELSNQLNLSRTPIHDTISRLSRERLVKLVPRKGAYVAEFYSDIFEHSIWLQSVFGIQAIQNIFLKNLGKKDISLLQEKLNLLNDVITAGDISQITSCIFNYYEQMYILSDNSDFIWKILKQYFSDYQRILFYSTTTSSTISQELYNDLLELTQCIFTKRPDQAYIVFNQHLSRLRLLLEPIRQLQPDYLATSK